MMTDIENAKQTPKVYYAKHMQAGICGYNDETILVDSDQMKSMAKSFVGKPVYVGHQVVDLANIKEQAAGYISDSFYNEVDGWLWVKFVIVDDNAHDAIAKKWAVSNAYVPTQWNDSGGTWHNCRFDRQIMAGEFTHLAIVPDPRYEGACIMSPDVFKIYQAEKKTKLNELHNSLTDGVKKIMFNLFKNSRTPVAADKVDAETMIELEGGKVVSVQEMINAVSCESKEDKDDELMDSEVTVGDEKVSIKELISRYNKMNMQNSIDADKAAKDAAEKANSLAAEEAAKAAADKAAAEAGKKHFDELRNAADNAKVEVKTIETTMNKLQRGKSRYGSDK